VQLFQTILKRIDSVNPRDKKILRRQPSKNQFATSGGKGTCIVERIQKNQPEILLTHLAYIAASQGVAYLFDYIARFRN
jgi:hypothetical protein